MIGVTSFTATAEGEQSNDERQQAARYGNGHQTLDRLIPIWKKEDKCGQKNRVRTLSYGKPESRAAVNLLSANHDSRRHILRHLS